MNKVSTILHMTRSESESLRRLSPVSDRLLNLPDGQAVAAAEFRALQAMFHDVLQVLGTGQRWQLAAKWSDGLLEPSWLRDGAGGLDEQCEDAANSVLLAGLHVLERCREQD